MISLEEALCQVKQQQQQHIASMRDLIAGNFPDTMRALKIIDMEATTPRRRKGFNLIKRESKKYGFLYYVRYSHNGKKIPSAWNTHTNILEKAEKFAMENKARLVEGYLREHDAQMYPLLENFYEDASAIQNSHLSEKCRKEYHASIINKFIPFLKGESITSFGQIAAKTLVKYQDFLLASGVRPQTVNNKLKPVKKILAHLARRDVIPENPMVRVQGVPVRKKDLKARGCYEVEKLKGAFNRRWKDQISYLLCLIIYTTGMRNSEIMRIRMEDIVSINGCRYIQINESKTQNGIRQVPLHDFTYRKLAAWASKSDKGPTLFGFLDARAFKQANSSLARQIGASEAEAKAENISFYSGRHFWKTLMSSEGLGEDVEEIFMGHKVSGDVSRLYNHRDKQGKRLLAKKARQVFSILDRRVFAAKP